MTTLKPKYWDAPFIPSKDDFNYTITDEIIDGRTVMGPWALMTPQAHAIYGLGLGTGYGQKYKKQADGRWLKIAG